MNRKLSVLSVEDSNDDAEILRLELISAGYDVRFQQVETAQTFKMALEEGGWDIVLSDHRLPGFDSFRALEILKNLEIDIPFIIVSGMIGEEAAVAAMKSGAHDYIIKGNLGRLVAVIEREIREAENRKQRRVAEAALETAYQAAKKAIRARDEFLLMASHELRTPLTVLLLQLQAIKDTDVLEAKIREKTESAIRHSRALGELIDRLLAVSTITNRGLRLVFEEFDLVTLVDATVKRFSQRTNDHQSTILFDSSAQSICGAWDRMKVDQVLVNLLSNATKFGLGKPIEVKLKTETPNWVIFSVSDQGLGISPEDQLRILNPFEQALPSRNFGGLGISLFITKAYIESHNGALELKSSLNHGSVFSVKLPLFPPANL